MGKGRIAWSILVGFFVLCSYYGLASLPAHSMGGAVAGCTSLDGPYCGFVNDKAVPAYMQAIDSANTDLGTSMPQVELLVKDLLKKLEKNNLIKPKVKKTSTDPQHDSGAFYMKGFAYPETNFVFLQPAEWIVRPGENWMMLSTYGKFQEFITLGEDGLPSMKEGSLVLTFAHPDTSQVLPACSRFSMHRVRRGLQRHYLDGVWAGRYSCAGSRTTAKVIITSYKSTKSQGLRLLKATFIFVAESFPGRDSTLAGCKCVQQWAYEGVSFNNGECGKPDKDGKAPWCFIEAGTCSGAPSGLNWDYCEEKTTADDVIKMVFQFNQEGDLINL